MTLSTVTALLQLRPLSSSRTFSSPRGDPAPLAVTPPPPALVTPVGLRSLQLCPSRTLAAGDAGHVVLAAGGRAGHIFPPARGRARPPVALPRRLSIAGGRALGCSCSSRTLPQSRLLPSARCVMLVKLCPSLGDGGLPNGPGWPRARRRPRPRQPASAPTKPCAPGKGRPGGRVRPACPAACSTPSPGLPGWLSRWPAPGLDAQPGVQGSAGQPLKPLRTAC